MTVRIPCWVFLVLGAALLLAWSLTGCGGSSSQPTTSRAGFAELSTARCKTSAAYPLRAGAAPASVRLPVPAAVVGELEVYVNGAGTKLPGPTGWRCKSGLGVDGSEAMSVYPAGQEDPLRKPGGSTGEGVTLQRYTACQGCVNGMVCALFPRARIVREYARTNGRCRVPNPAGQEIDSISPTTVLFKDPPGVRGQGNPSGGKDPAYGAVKLADAFPGTNSSSAQVTCTLPLDQGDLCSAIVASSLAGVLP